MFERVPSWLKENGSFCVWAYRVRDGKKTKVPYDPKTGAKARPNDRSTFSTFEEAVNKFNASEEYSGIGIGLFGDLVGIDIDHCVDSDGVPTETAADILASIESYAEMSPSGTGMHIICRGAGYHHDNDRYYTKNTEAGIELYAAADTHRFLTVTGDALNHSGVEDCTQALYEIEKQYMRRKNAVVDCEVAPTFVEDIAMDDDTVLTRMFSSKNGDKIAALYSGEWEELGYPSQSEADMALCNYLAFFTRKDEEQMQRLFEQSGLYRDDGAKQRSGKQYSTITIERAIKDCSTVWDPNYGKAVESTAGIQQAIDFLDQSDVLHNPRYAQDDIGAGYLLSDYLRPFARPLAGDKQWMVYDGSVWSSERGTERVEEAAKTMSRALLSYAAQHCSSYQDHFMQWTNGWQKSGTRRQYIMEASSVYPVLRSDFDKSKWLLNVKNGTLNLRDPANIVLQPHEPDDLLTQIADVEYQPNARCERFEHFVSEIMEAVSSAPERREQDTKEKTLFLKRYLGYCLCGDNKEESFLIMHGPTTRNGKSVLTRSVQTLMGSYAQSMNVETLMQGKAKDGSGPSENIARLAGTRMVSAGEVPQGGILDASKIKLLTGGDVLNGRFLKENSFDFIPQFKLILHTNHLPHCNDASVFSSGRILVLKFERHFSADEQDKNLKQVFSASDSRSGILNWMLEGYAGYVGLGGLRPPEVVQLATKEYQYNNDKIARFLDDMLIPAPGGILLGADVMQAYNNWACDNEEKTLNMKTLVSALEEHRVRTDRQRPPKYMGGGDKQRLVYGYQLKADQIKDDHGAFPRGTAA